MYACVYIWVIITYREFVLFQFSGWQKNIKRNTSRPLWYELPLRIPSLFTGFIWWNILSEIAWHSFFLYFKSLHPIEFYTIYNLKFSGNISQYDPKTILKLNANKMLAMKNIFKKTFSTNKHRQKTFTH